ncbi:hydrogenobyrinic acid a,c-diamide synthase (glutamine-hydrolyzing) [Bacteroidetes/Chlorobi group bacterium Naka2016]|jgi:cobyrinic acid a,c-diamide synthase|nr:MAG: hydrogenobyrinic acid a,c-diamide synthase (glutamine-hydrolyzing) [Bacteroidetes/Chlorobi group bacterium Naka2016]
MNIKRPRIIVAGLSGDSGKTLVSVGLTSKIKSLGYEVFPFKKGPDYIDPMWLSLASGSTARNLDTFIMGKASILESFLINSNSSGISIIEGNRGLYDGFDENGSHSTAELAKILDCPIILVVNVQKVTRTTGVILWGVKYFDIGLNIAGVIINNYSGKRHKEIISKSIVDIAGIPVIGAIPRLSDKFLFPSRHLGLTTPYEFASYREAIDTARQIVEDYVDVDQIIKIANNSNDIYVSTIPQKSTPKNKVVRIGYFWDSAFCFYYKENLEALEQLGAELVPISPMSDKSVPNVDGIYIGGGFPETNAKSLSENREFIEDLKTKVENGLPVFAECGGLIYLAEELEFGGNFEMSGILPIKISMSKKPVGHGYFEGIVDTANPFFDVGTYIRGHEFHYSFISEKKSEIPTTIKVTRGVGCWESRDGIVKGNTFASYVHLHTNGCPQWAKNFVELCFNKNKSIHKNSINIAL